MAGDVEEPFRLDFKADSLHSGSISFGRFETEVLCWERRSPFLHNRYLEEVEKCSKPGSVTDKKAYFEAHFKKKGNQNGTEEINHMNRQTNSLHFDDRLDGSVSGREHEFVETEKEVFGKSHSESQSQLSFDSGKSADCTEVHHASLSITNHVSDVPVGLSRDSNETKKSNNPIPLEAACLNPRMRPRVSVSQSRRYASTKASKGSEKMPRRTVESVQRSKPERKNSECPVQGKCPTKRTPKNELGSKANRVDEKKRGEKDSMSRRIAEPHSSTLQKFSSRVHQNADRVKPGAYTAMPCKNLDKSMFSFKCDKLAERRKEIVKRLRAREAEMGQLRAKIQEKKEAEIKELRKSLIFKARPLPSFYYEALHESDRNKALASNDTARSRNSNTGSRNGKSSRISSEKHKNYQVVLSRAPQKTRNPPDNTSGSTSCNSTVTSDSSPSSPNAVTRKSFPSGKKGKDKNNHTHLIKGIRRPTKGKSLSS